MTGVSYAEFSTHDVDVAHDFLQRLYTKHRVRATSPVKEFTLQNSTLRIDDVVVDAMTHTGGRDIQVTAALVRPICVQQRGVDPLRLTFEHHTLTIGPGETFLLPAGCTYDVSWDTFTAVNTILSPQTLAEDAGLFEAGDATEPPVFPIAAVARVQSHWTQVTALVRDLGRREHGVLQSPLARRELVRLLNTAALTCFPNSSQAEAGQAGATGGSAPVARAAAFIEEHADQPISLADIAAAARLHPRALQAAFRRHLDTTPLGHLRAVRLDRVRRELQAADAGAGASVTDVAVRWGFAQLGRFAGSYRQRYGELPSQTLRG